MPNDVKTVQSLASDLSAAFEHDKRNDGKEFTKLREGSPAWMTDVIHEVHGDKLPDDTVYAFIQRCAGAIHDYSSSIEDHEVAEQAVDEIEPDPYTADLTAWLNARVDHEYYLTEVLEEFGGDIKDGFQLLMAAQQKQIQEVGYALISALEKQVEESEEA